MLKLLFICTHNRCRSILAEAVTNHIGDGQMQAYSAGSAPQSQVHPLSLHFLEKNGIDTDGLKSQSWDDFADLNPDAILTLCDNAAAETCPVWFDTAVRAHWGLPDPSGESVSDDEYEQRFQRTIDVLKQRVEELAKENTTRLRGPILEQKLVELASAIQ